MKYIRTKDGRIVKHPHPNVEVFTFRYEILKIADTIEELCDLFVAFEDNRTFDILSRFKDFKREYGYVVNKNINCYGAIWTSKGLIYVAKMKENGEMELL